MPSLSRSPGFPKSIDGYYLRRLILLAGEAFSLMVTLVCSFIGFAFYTGYSSTGGMVAGG
jgi:hypothetical protein